MEETNTKISTKIILLSLINSIIVASINVIGSLVMRGGTATAPIEETTDAVATVQGGFLLPTPILIGLAISLVIGVILSYILGKIISKPILTMTDIVERTSKLDLREDHEQAIEKVMTKDEIGQMALAFRETRKVLREMVMRLQDISSTVTTHSNDLTKRTEENAISIGQVVSTIDSIAIGNNEQSETINDINESLLEMVKLIEHITDEASSGADQAVASLDAVIEGQKTIDLQIIKMDQNINVSTEANQSIKELSEVIENVSGIVPQSLNKRIC
ncbi:HAMP domain-containing protein [Bacillus suaedae]|uniref:HAMP domain-containing protein n=1 Tax=Halalkalibacter suaedae TaxID=2822140 RepID=UPI001FF07E02|nr:methyl-accepting chemotaxis protein [Bacillus suaedae]